MYFTIYLQLILEINTSMLPLFNVSILVTDKTILFAESAQYRKVKQFSDLRNQVTLK